MPEAPAPLESSTTPPTDTVAASHQETEPGEKPIPIIARAAANPTPGAPILKKASGSPTAPAIKPASNTSAPQKAVPVPGKVVATAGTSVPQTKKAPATPTPPLTPQRTGISSAAKMTIATMIGIFALILAVMLLKKSEANAEAKIYNDLINQVPAGNPIPLKARELEILLSNAASVGATEDRTAVYMALSLAEAADGTDIDKRIAEFATKETLVPNIRVVLLGSVLKQRANPEIIETLLTFAKSTTEPESAVAAMEAIRATVKDEHFAEILDFISSDNNRMRTAAEENAVRIIRNSSKTGELGSRLIEKYSSASEDTVRHAMLRLLGRIGGEKAMGIVAENLASNDKKKQIAAIIALQNWSSRDGFLELVEFIPTTTELDIRARAFTSAYQYSLEDQENTRENWTLLETKAKTQDEQIKVIRGVANVKPAPWAFALLKKIANTSDDEKAKDFAQRAIVRLRDRQKVEAEGKNKEGE